MALYAGVMSGTSLDGIDVAFAQIGLRSKSSTRPRLTVRLVASHYVPYPPALKDELSHLRDGKPTPIGEASRLHYALGHAYADAVLLGAAKAKIDTSRIAAIGLHGQTVWHAPPSSLAAGGEGAPLIPFADYILLASPTETRAVLNVGGIANVTFLPAGGELVDTIAFDTGPGNLVIDSVVRTLTAGKKSFDKAGALAAKGAPSEPILVKLLAHPYFSRRPPKSTGAELFGASYAQGFLALCGKLAQADTVATATMFTARSVADAFAQFLPTKPHRLILGGGGAHNATLKKYLANLLPDVTLCTHADLGLDDDSKEALAFAILAAAHAHGIPANIPSATGAAHARVLGSLTNP